MDYEKAVIDFLSAKENICIVWDVNEYFQRVKEKLHMDFWDSVKRTIDEKLKDSNPRWLVCQIEKLLGQHGGFIFQPIVHIPQNPLIFGLQQEWRSGFYQLFISIQWKKQIDLEMERNRLLQNDLVLELMKTLEQNKLKTNESSWALGWDWIEWRPQSKDFCIRVATDVDFVSSDVATTFWSFFESYREQVEKVNEAIERIAIERIATK